MRVITLLEKYEKYLFNHFLPDTNPPTLDLLVPGWKVMIRENLTPIFEEELHMRQVGDYVWASEYEDGRRKVVSFFRINDAYATLKWGWNFDFVPVPSGNKTAFARTDKSIVSHIFEVSQSFYESNSDEEDRRKQRKKTIMSKSDVDTKDIEVGLETMIMKHKDVVYNLLPLIKKYYSITDSYEKIMKRIDHNMQIDYYHIINSGSLIAKVFIEKRLGLSEKAFQDFEQLSYWDEHIKEEFYKRLCQLKVQ